MTKTGLGLGLALFLFGATDAKVALAMNGDAILGRGRMLFFDTEQLGIALVLFPPIIFGIMFPPAEQMVDADPQLPDTGGTLVLEPGCAYCPALVDYHNHILWGVGPNDATVMVVEEASGANSPSTERWRGDSWTGIFCTARRSGRHTREMVTAVGYESDVFYTSAAKCFPLNGKGSNHTSVTIEKMNCRDHLVSGPEVVDPDVVVPTDRHTTESALALDDASLDGFLDTVLDPVESG